MPPHRGEDSSPMIKHFWQAVSSPAFVVTSLADDHSAVLGAVEDASSQGGTEGWSHSVEQRGGPLAYAAPPGARVWRISRSISPSLSNCAQSISERPSKTDAGSSGKSTRPVATRSRRGGQRFFEPFGRPRLRPGTGGLRRLRSAQNSSSSLSPITAAMVLPRAPSCSTMRARRRARAAYHNARLSGLFHVSAPR